MIRQIAFCLAAALVLSLTLGCGQKNSSVKVTTGLKPDSKEKQAASYPGRVAQILDMFKDPIDEDGAARRVRGARASLNMAKEPNLPAEERAKLVDRLKTVSAAEKNPEALSLEKEALNALEHPAS